MTILWIVSHFKINACFMSMMMMMTIHHGHWTMDISMNIEKEDRANYVLLFLLLSVVDIAYFTILYYVFDDWWLVNVLQTIFFFFQLRKKVIQICALVCDMLVCISSDQIKSLHEKRHSECPEVRFFCANKMCRSSNESASNGWFNT